MFRHSTAVHPLYSPNTPLRHDSARRLPRRHRPAHLASLLHALRRRVHERGRHARAPSRHAVRHPRAFLGEHRHQPRFHRLVRRCVYRRDGRGGGEAGGEAAVQSEDARLGEASASTLARGCRAARSACMVTLSVSTGCSTMLTSVPATAPATAFAVVTRPPPPERPRSSSRVDAPAGAQRLVQ